MKPRSAIGPDRGGRAGGPRASGEKIDPRSARRPAAESEAEALRRGGRIFPRRLRRSREERGWSQADLAARAGLQQSALSHYENATRRPSFTNLRRLARALDVSTDYLVGQTSHPAAPRPPASDDLPEQIARLRPADREVVRALVASLLRNRP
jgi:transcriptional regulator with XRE-family HTH domain